MKYLMRYQGTSSNVNGSGSPYLLAVMMQQYDKIILKGPFAVGLSGPTATGLDPDFFNNIRLSSSKVFITVDITPSANILTAEAAVVSAKAQMALIYSSFSAYKINEQLEGFYIQNFGYGRTPYSDASRLSRAQQNEIVSAAHASYELPVAVSAAYSPDLFSIVGTTARGNLSEDNTALWISIVGRNPTIRDLIICENPIYNPADNSDINPSRASEMMATYNFTQNIHRNADVVAMQVLSGTYVNDANLGVKLLDKQPIVAHYANFIRSLGVPYIGAAIDNYGENNLLLPAQNLKGDVTESLGATNIYSSDKTIFVEGQAVIEGKTLNKVWKFSGDSLDFLGMVDRGD